MSCRPGTSARGNWPPSTARRAGCRTGRGCALVSRGLASVRSAVHRQWSDPLSRGGLALLINTGLTGVLGFAYWIIAARLFSTYAVGAAGALVSAATLFAGLGQLNLSGMLMRFLPRSGVKSRRLTWLTYAFAAVVSGLLATACLLGIRHFAAPHSALRLNLLQSLLFAGSVAATAIFVIQDSVLIAVRQAIWIPIENGTFGVAKIALLFVFAPFGTAFAVFGAWMIPLTLTIPVISAVLFFRFLPRPERPPPGLPRRVTQLGRRARSKMIRFATGDAFGGLFTQAWTYLPPVIITTLLGASVNALYYISFLFASTIDQIAANFASPLTVEGAHVPAEVAPLIRSTLRRIYAIVLPVVTLLVIGCPWLIRAFGDKYAGAVPAMRLLLLACLPKVLSTVYYAYCRIDRSTHKSAVMQGYVCVVTLTAVILLARPYRLTGICLAVLAVQTSTGLYSWWALRRGPLRAGDQPVPPGRHRRELTRTAR